jgi:hypothetical protein
MLGFSLIGLVLAVLIYSIVSYNLQNDPYLKKIHKYADETFVTDISKSKIIYDTVPYGSSGLFYDYVIGSPYYYNPLDYWLNPYFYSWYGPTYTSTSYASSSPYVKKVRHVRRSRRRHR